MKGRDFLPLARKLATATTEAEWRTAVSRAYYAAFHVARQLLEDVGFRVPRTDSAHTYLAYRLSNSGDSHVQQAGSDLDALRTLRNQADYDVRQPFRQSIAVGHVPFAEHIINILDSATREPLRTQITNAMKIYERNALGIVTWHP